MTTQVVNRATRALSKGAHVVRETKSQVGAAIRNEQSVDAGGAPQGIERHNWKGDLTYHARAVEVAHSVDDIVRIVKDRDRYPSPVRGAGSQHSTTLCIEANQGTIVVLTKMNKILEIDRDKQTIRMQAGVLHIDAAKELEKHGLAFNVNIEIGNATVGSIACCGTKDGSFPDGYGQVSSYLIAAKLVTASGELLEVTEAQPELLRAVRSSFGMLGIVYEVTFRVRRLTAMTVRHKIYTLDEFTNNLREIVGDGSKSIMMYLFPHLDRVVVEFRHYIEGEVKSRWQWKLRNWMWKTGSPAYANFLSRNVSNIRLRSFLLNCCQRVQVRLLTVVRGTHTCASDQIIRYPQKAGYDAYTFSIWAFPESQYPQALRDYFRFCKDYLKQHGFRCDMLNVGYRIAKDTSSIFSYTGKETMLTFDPVSTAPPGWQTFLDAYNEFCIKHNGRPLFNQSPRVTPAQVKKAFAAEVEEFQKFRRRLDPDGRLYSSFFRERFE